MQYLATLLALMMSAQVAACADIKKSLLPQNRGLASPCEKLEIMDLTGSDQEDSPGFPWESPSVLLTLRENVGKGDAQAAYCLYDISTTNSEKRHWICRAANLGLPIAQETMARLYYPRPGDAYRLYPRNMVKAVLWSREANRNGRSLQAMERLLTASMTAEQHAEVVRLMADWRLSTENCDRSNSH